jgi:hypothetical protein
MESVGGERKITGGISSEARGKHVAIAKFFDHTSIHEKYSI